MRIYHIATAADWAEAKRTGSYTTSTRGRTLAEEGFIHASRREQVPAVFDGFYRDAREPLLLLTIETDRLDVPWREDPVGDDTFPHVYGPLRPRAVVDAQPLDRRGGTQSLTTLFVQEMFLRIGLALAVMLLTALGVALGRGLDAGWGPLLGGAVGFAVGAAAFAGVLRRRG
ncbi:MAG: DUF952 domain-containing protein [Nocardioidaceae bacterium]